MKKFESFTNATEQTKKDIETAREENKDVICIQLAAKATSPYGDNFVYESNPCVIKSLVKLGWEEVTYGR